MTSPMPHSPFPRDLLRRALHRHPEREALVWEGGSWTYAELRAAALTAAGALAARGIGAGDRVALVLRNGPEFVAAHLAIAWLGAVRVPLNEMLSATDVAYMLDHSGAAGVIAHASLAARVPDHACPACRLRVAEDATPDGWMPDGWEDHAAALAAIDPRAPDPDWPDVAPDDPAMILYTGGTTGRSKGVLHTQAALGANLLSHVMHCDIEEDDRLLLSTPLPHSAHLVAEAALVRGARITLSRGFDAGTTLAAVGAGEATWLFLVPTMIYRLLDHPNLAATDTRGLRTILYGAAPMAPARLKAGLAAFGQVFVQLYGLTEVPNFICQLPKADHLDPTLRGACGRPTAFCDVRISGEGGNDGTGEVEVRGAYTLARYHDDPERTADAFTPDGWFRTGDVGYLGPTGHLHLIDRAKDMIVTGGMNVYSVEVEGALATHPSVAQAVVIGVPDDDWGEAVVAFVVPRGEYHAEEGESDFDPEALRKHCRATLARYKVPKRIEMIAAIPLTAYGKPDKKRLRAPFWEGRHRGIG